jgi:alanyl-tRNA synthetase
MTAKELREKFLKFMKSKGHTIIPSASLVPENDPSVLFTTAGMQQFKEFYLDPDKSKNFRVATIQKCVRTIDIDEVGDKTHLTFFEMLGNFSFGYPDKPDSYFKEETINYAWEFLTESLGIDKKRIYATYFKGEKGVAEDTESLNILKNIKGLSKIIPQGFEDNFWSLGTENSPGGPTIEFYIDGIEVWNCVFNEYILKDGNYKPASNKGVDTGMGFERLLAVLNDKETIFETELFQPIFHKINNVIPDLIRDPDLDSRFRGNDNVAKSYRIIADHLKAATFIISDGAVPSNIGRGYVVRRLVRRAVRYGKQLGIESNFLLHLSAAVVEVYKDFYKELETNKGKIFEELEKEEDKFRKKLSEGIKHVEKIKEYIKHSPDRLKVDWDKVGILSFDLYQTYGFPLELVFEELSNIGLVFTEDESRAINRGYINRFIDHQDESRTASAGMFKGGLADSSEGTKKLHTAAHLLLAALRKILGDNVVQKGSNITSERLRFDFSYPEKLTPEQIKEAEDLVNDAIAKNLPVVCEEMNLEEAKKQGAMGVFEAKYGEKVKVYRIGEVSNEICGGPHAENTGQLGHFKITKEESSSAGVRRIKAVLE